MNRLSLFLLINFIIVGLVSVIYYYYNQECKTCKECPKCDDCPKCKDCPPCKDCPICPKCEDCQNCEKCLDCPKFDKIVKVTEPRDDNMDNDFIKKYITTIYPMLPDKDYNNNYWKTLDFYYTLNCYTDIYRKDDTSFYYPDDRNFRTANLMFANIIKSFEENTKNKKLLFRPSKTQYGNNYLGYDMINRSDFSYIPEIYNLNLLPLCSVGSSNDDDLRKRGIIRGLFVNRYNPDNVVISTAYCKTGTANTELATTDIPGVSLFLIRDGFKSNSLIEISHCDTSSPSNNISSMSFNTKTSKYGKWLYYTRGSGIFYNLGKTDFAYNKVHALLKLNGLTNSMDGYLKLVDKYGIDDDKNKTCTKDNTVQPYDFSDISYNNCCTQGHKPTDQIWCTNDVFLNHLMCCKNCPKVCSGDDISAPCNDCLFPSYRTWDWRAFLPIIPEKYKTEREQLAWILFASVNGSSEFNSRTKKEDYNLYKKQLLQFSNLGGNADGALQTLVMNNKLDSLQLTMQCNINGSYSIEIFTYNLDYDNGQQAPSIVMKNLFIANPLGDDKDKVQCTTIPNPLDTTKQLSLMKCGKLTWGEPYTMPIWSDNKEPLNVIKCPSDLNTIKCVSQDIVGCPEGNIYDNVDGDCQTNCQKNCNNIEYNPNNSIISASCLSMDGNYDDRNLDISYCDDQVNTCDGILHCGDCPIVQCENQDTVGCPKGNFYDSCNNVEYHPLSNYLIAQCQGSDSDDNYTTLYLGDCKDSISNCDGNLNCGDC